MLGALPVALGKLGHRVTLVTPKYRSTQGQGTSRTIQVPGIGGAIAETRVVEQRVAENVRAVLIDRPELYDRDSLYGTGGDYPDTPAALGFCVRRRSNTHRSRTRHRRASRTRWQAGLAPVYLRTRYASVAKLHRMPAILRFTIGLSGKFAADVGAAGVGQSDGDRRMEYWGQISLLKGGIAFSDSAPP